MSAIDRWTSKEPQAVTMASGNTRSQAFTIRGMAWGMIRIPAGWKGDLSAQVAFTNSDFDPAHAESGTRKNVVVIGVTKPFKLMLPPEWLGGNLMRIVASSAQTGGGAAGTGKTLRGFFKG